MKRYITLITLLLNTIAYGCPTCIGRLDKQSPPFFSDEHYQPKKNNKIQKKTQTKNIPNRRKRR